MTGRDPVTRRPHRALASAQGAGAIAASLVMAPLLRRLGPARMTGLALAALAVGDGIFLARSAPVVLAGSAVSGVGLLWLVAVAQSAIQRYTPPRLQGRATAAWTMAIVTPQNVSIAVGAALISFVSYRILLLAVIAALGACAAVLLSRPAAEPAPDGLPQPVSVPVK